LKQPVVLVSFSLVSVKRLVWSISQDNDRLLCQGGFPFILVNILKKLISSVNGPRARQVGLFLTMAVAATFLPGLPAVLANSPGQAGQAANKATSQDAGAGAGTVAGDVSASDEAAGKSEESLLTMALEQLKAHNLAGALTNFVRLKDEFPDNDDYLLLYRTALRLKNSSDADSQKWYNYVRALDKKEEEKHTFFDASKDALSGPAHGHINELKRENWLVLTTGKHKSLNAGRRVQQEPK
jgi:hypothetical protein